jgi:hypothetical protein
MPDSRSVRRLFSESFSRSIALTLQRCIFDFACNNWGATWMIVTIDLCQKLPTDPLDNPYWS